MRTKLTIVLTLLALLLIAAPASAARPTPVGSRIDLLTLTPTSYPENTAFHLMHGWSFSPDDTPAGFPLRLFSFALEVDGTPVSHDFILRDGGRGGARNTWWVFNFPTGMTGTHTFTGFWLAPCQYVVDAGVIPGPCADPTEPVEFFSQSLTVEFTP